MKEDIELFKISFKSNQPGSYNKGLGKLKDQLRAKGFPVGPTNELIKKGLDDKTLERLRRTIDKDALLLSMPIKLSDKEDNIMPRIYANQLSDKLGNQALDLTEYLKVRQDSTARSGYSSTERAMNFFNIGYRYNDSKEQLVDALKGKQALLVDDVLTTGETMVAMATFLKYEIGELDIIGGHAIAAVDNRTPTPRDIARLTEKLLDNLPIDTDAAFVENIVRKSLGPFTRKKLMRFELYANTPEGAEKQLDAMIQDSYKMESSIGESLSGELYRFRLDELEVDKIKNTPLDQIHPSLAERAIMDYFPEAVFIKSENGNIKLFSDKSQNTELSLTGDPAKNMNEVLLNAIDFMRHNNFSLTNSKSTDQGISY